jgi:predicted translin family RNA/ssDNA-binding protein
MSKQVNDAEKVLSELQSRRARLVANGVEIGDQRAAISYDAHVSGNAKAEKRLAELHREATEHASQLAGLDAAIKTAGEKLAQAQ